MNLYKKCTAKPYCFLMNYTTIASDNPLRFRRNLLETIQKLWQLMKWLKMKLQYGINRKAAKMSTLLSGKIDKYEYLTVEERLSTGHSRMIE